MSDIPFTVSAVTRHVREGGRPFWSAEVLADGLRAGVDNVFGSWTIYETTEGEPLRGLPGDTQARRRELLPRVSFVVADEVRKAEDRDEAPRPALRRR